mmetsp:Transcript_17187/g.45504  ORF Transcript_17187/g.45504 Transcript_17187/m.45504 type:complete len:210 (+) Transcript_17187:1874-2503(+)
MPACPSASRASTAWCSSRRRSAGPWPCRRPRSSARNCPSPGRSGSWSRWSRGTTRTEPAPTCPRPLLRGPGRAARARWTWTWSWVPWPCSFGRPRPPRWTRRSACAMAAWPRSPRSTFCSSCSASATRASRLPSRGAPPPSWPATAATAARPATTRPSPNRRRMCRSFGRPPTPPPATRSGALTRPWTGGASRTPASWRSGWTADPPCR